MNQEIYNDMLEMFIGERIGEVLNGCKRRRSEHYEKEMSLMNALEEEDKKRVLDILSDYTAWGYEDSRTAYCAGVEDGICIARKILSV